MHEKTLTLKIRNHPAAIARIAGLFARRAYSLSTMECRPDDDKRIGNMSLLVPDDSQLSQIVKNLEKLYDVHEVMVTDVNVPTLITDPDWQT